PSCRPISPADGLAMVMPLYTWTERLLTISNGRSRRSSFFAGIHLEIRTLAAGDLGRWVRWLLVAHAQLISSPLPHHGARVAEALQVIPGAERRSLGRRAALCGAQCATCRAGGASRGLEVVELAGVAGVDRGENRRVRRVFDSLEKL